MLAASSLDARSFLARTCVIHMVKMPVCLEAHVISDSRYLLETQLTAFTAVFEVSGAWISSGSPGPANGCL